MAKIKIDLDRQLGRVDRKIFGGFIEHLGRCIYGGIYDEGSPLSNQHGYRVDVMEAIRALRLPVLRWPGGNFASGYHWQDGIGPQDQRPRRVNLSWHTEEPNRFGTDEFIHYCRLIGTEPYLCANLGSGTLDEAQAWVEYCNGTGNTYWANLRRQHGHTEPYQVRYWGLGNEMYGEWQIGALTAQAYVERAREFAKVMKWTDPNIKLVSCGQSGWDAWDRVVLEGLAPYIDYHSIHIYTGSFEHYSNIFSVHHAERALDICQAMIEQARYEQHITHPIKVAYDEWNVWYRESGGAGALEEAYDLTDALAVATYLNIFIRHCNSVGMANLAQLVNVIAPIFTSTDGLFLQTIYHPFWLYATLSQEIALDIYVESEQYTLSPEVEAAGASRWTHRVADLGPFKLLDATATCDPDRRQIALAVVNRDREAAHTATIQFMDGVAAGIDAHEVNGEDVTIRNSFDQPQAVSVQRRPLEQSGSAFDYTFPAHSVTMLRFQMDEQIQRAHQGF
ncbi:MAG TPA: alpha-L-arabinofuranosidase C-terminal domain-containing protein [Ktedonobacterales bacterium]|nr:alpha-L-arabinofuranosidase C-terminal domain-containing protein [Ktedonobacterales bacterium]